MRIVNDSVNPSDPADSWDKVWNNFMDSGTQPDGSRDALVSLRCRILDELITRGWFYEPCELRLHKGTAEQPHRVQLTIYMPNPKNNYIIKAQAKEPKGTVFCTY
jgi:hypothetical protein